MPANITSTSPDQRKLSRSNAPRNNSTANNQLPEREDLPSLSVIHDKFVPTIKNVPLKLRRLWSQCLAKSLAQAVWSNTIESWTELQMLPKCTLCRPSRGGRSHKSQKLAWTQARLQRWLAGERSGLWHDIPQFKRPKPKNVNPGLAIKQRQDRCISLTG